MSFSSIDKSLSTHQIALLFDDILTGSRGASVSANSVASASFLPKFLLDQQLDRSYRSGSLQQRKDANSGNVFITFSLGAARVVGASSLNRHNIRHRIRMLLYRGSPSLSDGVYTGPWLDPIVRASLSDYTYRNFDWTLGPGTQLLETLTDQKRLDTVFETDQEYTGITHIRYEIDGSGYGEPGDQQRQDYYQIGMALAGRVYQNFQGMSWGWELSTEDRSIIEETPQGSVVGRDLGRARVMRFEFRRVEQVEAFERIITDFSRRRGKLGRILVLPRPSARRNFYDISFIGTAVDLPGVSERLHRTYESSWVIKETE